MMPPVPARTGGVLGVRLAQAAVEADRTGFTVVNGISANRHRLAELGDAAAAIGYAPRDDAWE